ncbi:N-acetyl sugar amidotransferase [Photorhabdus heterorhabditis]|uniref:N-acetyl sugar amidotransferase n=1 Tax=Photorhabdus heterorhabditis TaxID=880156 RepID=UPI001BD60173|nr:N-acetyl sugar amidotransferase [Photorhabdus heterorhabditis]MBS9442723.1 N-acetyl sugar amidotransferase [Photorhabdus heterorhabditis]
MKKYQVCTRCVMDTTDPTISFDSNGVCNHCNDFDNKTSKSWYPTDLGKEKLNNIIKKIKASKKNEKYDCIIGLSGGIDSAYLAVILKDYGLNPLVIHIDAGWNSELAVYNIEQVIKHTGFDFHTHVMNWNEIRDLQVAYLKSGVANQDVVQDHAFFSTLYHYAIKHKIKYVISGGNIATESVVPTSWHHSAMDAINLHDIHKKFGVTKLKYYKTISIFQYYFTYPFIHKFRTVRPLNYLPYNKKDALTFLKEKIDYKDYGRKHGESIFTKFFQNYYLPTKFNYDKRRPHLSSLILSKQLTREESLLELEQPLYDDNELREDFSYIAKKLKISENDLNEFIRSPGKNYSEYKNWDSYFRFFKKIQQIAEKTINKNIKNYS